jgi:hypothetical protein
VNKFLMVVSLIGVFFSMNTMAQDKPVEIDGKHILVTEFKVGLKNKLSLKKKDIENGVYVYLGENSPFPNVKK